MLVNCCSKSLKKNRLKILLLTVGLIFILGNCGKSEKAKHSIPAARAFHNSNQTKNFRSPPKFKSHEDLYAPITEPGRPISLGFGIETNNQQGIPNRCIEGSTEAIPTQEGFFSLDTEFARDEIIDSLGIKADGSYRFGISGVSARGQFLKSLTKNSADANYVVFAYHKDKSQVFIPLKRNDSSKDYSPTEFLSNCGNAYVAAQDFGSMILLKFSLHLDEKDKNSSWGGNIGGNYLSFAKLKVDIQKISKEKNTKGTLSISALQIGGIPSELGKILKTKSDSGLIENFTLCDVKKLESCMSGLRSVEDYIANIFPKQIEDSKQGGSALLNTYPFRYPKTLGTDSSPGLDPLIAKARKELSLMYDEEMEDLAKVSRNQNKTSRKEDETLVSEIQKNLELIRSTLDFCYHNESYPKCLSNLENLKSKVSCTFYSESKQNTEANQSRENQKKQAESQKNSKE